jgi:choline-glycine betaine transporter
MRNSTLLESNIQELITILCSFSEHQMLIGVKCLQHMISFHGKKLTEQMWSIAIGGISNLLLVVGNLKSITKIEEKPREVFLISLHGCIYKMLKAITQIHSNLISEKNCELIIKAVEESYRYIESFNNSQMVRERDTSDTVVPQLENFFKVEKQSGNTLIVLLEYASKKMTEKAASYKATHLQ